MGTYNAQNLRHAHFLRLICLYYQVSLLSQVQYESWADTSEDAEDGDCMVGMKYNESSYFRPNPQTNASERRRWRSERTEEGGRHEAIDLLRSE